MSIAQICRLTPNAGSKAIAASATAWCRLNLHKVIWEAAIDLLRCNTPAKVEDDQDLRKSKRLPMECSITSGHPQVCRSSNGVASVQDWRYP